MEKINTSRAKEREPQRLWCGVDWTPAVLLLRVGEELKKQESSFKAAYNKVLALQQEFCQADVPSQSGPWGWSLILKLDQERPRESLPGSHRAEQS